MDTQNSLRDGLLTVVLPAYNEQDSVPLAADTICPLLEKEGIRHEILFVNDGSRDGTWKAIQAQTARHPQVRGVCFSRNFGKEAAIFAGLAQAKGDCAVVLDCDLQHPPEKIVEMYRLWQQGYQVVEGVKVTRGKESPLHTLAAKTFYHFISSATKIDMSRASDFKLLDRRAVDVLVAMREKNAFFRALSSWIGFETTQVEFEVQPRAAGSPSGLSAPWCATPSPTWPLSPPRPCRSSPSWVYWCFCAPWCWVAGPCGRRSADRPWRALPRSFCSCCLSEAS